MMSTEKERDGVPLVSSPVEFSVGTKDYSGNADIELRLSPIPHIRAEIQLSTLEHPLEALHLALARPKVKLIIGTTNSEIQAHIVGGGTDPPRVYAQVNQITSSLHAVDVLVLRSTILNFPSFVTPIDAHSLYINSIDLLTDEWKVEIGPTDDSENAFNHLKEAGGYAITHQCFVTRADGEKIKQSDVQPLLLGLRYFLSFSAGRWITLPYSEAYEGAPSSQWWDLSPCTPWGHIPSWFDPQHGDHLRIAFDGFWRKWNDPVWNNVLRSAVFWYISSNDSTGIDGSVILSQTALEFLTWSILAVDRKYLSPKQFRKTPAAERIRMLLGELGIDATIPSHLTDLPALGAPDGPAAIVRLRNSLVHPDPNQFTNPSSPAVKIDAWQLAQWYIELILLRECGYWGQYGNRLRRRHAGETEDVPWQ
jgi:hypothetical protein